MPSPSRNGYESFSVRHERDLSEIDSLSGSGQDLVLHESNFTAENRSNHFPFHAHSGERSPTRCVWGCVWGAAFGDACGGRHLGMHAWGACVVWFRGACVARMRACECVGKLLTKGHHENIKKGGRV